MATTQRVQSSLPVAMPSLQLACMYILFLLLSIAWPNQDESPNFLVLSRQQNHQSRSIKMSPDLSVSVNKEATLLRLKRGVQVDISNKIDEQNANDTSKSNEKSVKINEKNNIDSEPSISRSKQTQASKVASEKNQIPVSTTSKDPQQTNNRKKLNPKLNQRKKVAKNKSRLIRTNNGQCEYIKGPWQECQRNGIQQRVLKLAKPAATNNKPPMTSNKHNSANNNHNMNNTNTNNNTASQLQSVRCDPVRVIRRECNTGCKYLRGQWSPKCVNGQRLRIDTLIGPRWRRQQHANAHSNNSATTTGQQQVPLITCQPQRKVIKDCRRTCHYIKSEWSECQNGFMQRTLSLDERPLENLITLSKPSQQDTQPMRLVAQTGIGCAKTKTIRRACNTRTKPKSPKFPQHINSTLSQNTQLGGSDNTETRPPNKNKRR